MTAAAPPPCQQCLPRGCPKPWAFPGHPCLRPDRSLWPRRRLRLAGPHWDGPAARRTGQDLQARQGVPYELLEDVLVRGSRDPGTPVPRDGVTTGRGRHPAATSSMKGYLKDPKDEPSQAFAGGWFHTGGLATVAVHHADGYAETPATAPRTSSFPAAENISSIEVEDALYKHPDVSAAGVVAWPDEKWGETPCAFIELKPGATTTEDDIFAHCRDNLAGFKCPRHVVFGPLPKTSTGKIQKFKLRDQAVELANAAA